MRIPRLANARGSVFHDRLWVAGSHFCRHFPLGLQQTFQRRPCNEFLGLLLLLRAEIRTLNLGSSFCFTNFRKLFSQHAVSRNDVDHQQPWIKLQWRYFYSSRTFYMNIRGEMPSETRLTLIQCFDRRLTCDPFCNIVSVAQLRSVNAASVMRAERTLS